MSVYKVKPFLGDGGSGGGGKLYCYYIDPSNVSIVNGGGVSVLNLFILSSKKFNKLSEFTEGEYLSINSNVNVPTEEGSTNYTIQAFIVVDGGLHISTDNLDYNLEITDDIDLDFMEV